MAGAAPGIHGGWIHVVHTYPSAMALDFSQAIVAFSVNFILTVSISYMTQPRPESELIGQAPARLLIAHADRDNAGDFEQ